MKKIVNVSLILLIGVFLLTGCGNAKKDNKDNNVVTDESGEKVNNSEELNKDKTFNDFKISGISLKTENGSNMLTATIENTSSKTTEAGVYNIVFTDKTGKEITKVAVYLKALSPNESLEIKSSINIDVISSYDFKLEKV